MWKRKKWSTSVKPIDKQTKTVTLFEPIYRQDKRKRPNDPLNARIAQTVD